MHHRVSQIVSAKPRTCDYVWKTEFSDWLQKDELNRLFWFAGKPGSGKSTLMKYLVSSEVTRQKLTIYKPVKWTVVHFFFDFRAAKGLANTEQGLYRSLLHQVILALPLSENTFEKYDLSTDQLAFTATVQYLTDTIIQIMTGESLNMLLLVDGLDESEGNLSFLVEGLRRICTSTNMRICIASRPEPLIVAIMHDIPRTFVHKHNSSGIANYLQLAFERFERCFKGYSIEVSDVAAQLLDRAQGVFLWVVFAANTLLNCIVSGCSSTEAWSEVDLMPVELEAMYDRIFGRIPFLCRNEVAFYLLLLRDATFTVTLEMMYRVWLFAQKQTIIQGGRFEAIPVAFYDARLRGLLGGLVDIEDNVKSRSWPLDLHTSSMIRISHETLRTYLRTSSIVTAWICTEHQDQYPNNIWLRLFTNMLISNSSTLRGIPTLREGMRTMKLGSARVNVRNNLREDLIIDLSRSCLGVDVDLMADQILDSVSWLLLSQAPDDFVDEYLLRKVAEALSSPLILLHDLLYFAYTRSQGFTVSELSLYHWHLIGAQAYDIHRCLAFAASRQWLAFLQYHKIELENLEPYHKDYILSCAISRSILYTRVNPPQYVQHLD